MNENKSSNNHRSNCYSLIKLLEILPFVGIVLTKNSKPSQRIVPILITLTLLATFCIGILGINITNDYFFLYFLFNPLLLFFLISVHLLI